MSERDASSAAGLSDRVTIVLVTRNSASVLPISLGSLPEACRVILVDAMSTDDTLDVARRSHPRVETTVLTQDRGLGAATNQGLARVETEYVLNINPDTQLMPGCLEQLLATADANPNAAGIAPQLTNARGNLEIDVMGPNEIRHSGITVLPEGPFCTWFITGAVVLWRIAALRAVAGFDENIFLYNEDTDLCVRCARAGYALILDPDARADHFGGRSEEISLRSRIRRDWNMVWGHLIYERKHGKPGEAEAIAREIIVRSKREAWIGLLTFRRRKYLTNRMKRAAAEGFLRGDTPWGH
jgi:GT2 family glycosyltransferase